MYYRKILFKHCKTQRFTLILKEFLIKTFNKLNKRNISLGSHYYQRSKLLLKLEKRKSMPFNCGRKAAAFKLSI